MKKISRILIVIALILLALTSFIYPLYLDPNDIPDLAQIIGLILR